MAKPKPRMLFHLVRELAVVAGGRSLYCINTALMHANRHHELTPDQTKILLICTGAQIAETDPGAAPYGTYDKTIDKWIESVCDTIEDHEVYQPRVKKTPEERAAATHISRAGAKFALELSLRRYMRTRGGGNHDKFIVEAIAAIDEVLDGFGTAADAKEETKQIEG